MLETLTTYSPAHTITQHARLPTRSPTGQNRTSILWQAEVLKAVQTGLVPTAISTLLQTHADDLRSTEAHMQRTAVTKAATQLTYCNHMYLHQAATLHQTEQTQLIPADLQQWHIHRQQRIAAEHERYAHHKPPYKVIPLLDNAMTDTGHRTITTVRQEDGFVTTDPATVLQATQDSFLHQHTPTQGTLDTDAQSETKRLPKVFNHAQRRQLKERRFTIHKVWKAIHSLRSHQFPGYDSLSAKA